jgi:tetratricopeptide (TPR) repeat protein
MKLAEDGYTACLTGDFDTAVTKLSTALQTTLPGSQRRYVYLNRGFAYNNKWRFDNAIRDFDAALQLDPKLPEAYAYRGTAYERKGETDKAIVDFNKAADLDPNSAIAHFHRGLIFLNKGEWDRALVDFDEAVRVDPANGDALVNRGICYLNKKDYEHALVSFDAAISIDSRNVTAFQNRGDLYRRLGDREKSARDLEQAALLSPPPAQQSSAIARTKPLFPPLNPAGERRLPSISSAITFDTQIKELWQISQTDQQLISSAELAARAGDPNHTIEVCNAALANKLKVDSTATLVMLRAKAYSKKGDFEHALHDYDEATTLDPNQIGSYIGRAIVLARKKDYPRASKELDAITHLNTRSLNAALNSVAWIWATYPEERLRDGKKALESAEKACQLSQWKDWGYIDTLAAAYAETGNFDQAVKYEELALQTAPVQGERLEPVKRRLGLYHQHKPYRERPPEG